jgi:tripartite-type tricarboxylate transporter receptor subunit TctC
MKLAGFLAALCIAGAACAQSEKPVHIVVPFPPGGGADALARIIAPNLSATWKTQVVVENKPGASGHIGADQVAQSPADGKTLLMSSTGALTEKNVSQFAPVSLVSASPYVVVLSLKNGFSSVGGLLSYARSNPGKLSFGSSGTGAASHLSGELFKSMAKVDLLHVPYKGMGQATTDLLAGQIDLLFAPAQAVMQHVRAGKLKAIATTGARRSETLPELPTVAESGVQGYESIGWFGLLAPAATPKATVERLSADVNRVLAEADVRKKIRDLGADPAGNSPEAFARFIRDDQAKWARLSREAGLKLD